MEHARSDFKPFTAALVTFLSTKSDGQVFDFNLLDKVAGIDVRANRSVIDATKKKLLAGYRKLLISVRKQGYKLADADSKLSESESYRNRSYKSVNKAVQILRSVDQSKLTPIQQPKFNRELIKNLNLSEMGKAIENPALTDKSTVKRLEQSDLLKAILA